MDALDRAIVNALQTDLPVTERPFADAAESLGVTDSELLERTRRLQEAGIFSRVGPLYRADRMGGEMLLAAMKVPEESFESVAEIVNSFREVAHNYARDHTLNMWFVISAETPERGQTVIQAIEARTGLRVYSFPREKEYFIGLRLEI